MSVFDEGDAALPPGLEAETSTRDRAAAAPVPPSCAHVLDLACMAERLCRLGPVLWLEHAHAARDEPVLPPKGIILLEQPMLAPLARARRVSAQVAVTSVGLRERLRFIDAGGQLQAQLFLLPDTDCLAWDEMTAACQLHAEPAAAATRWNLHQAFRRGAFSRLAAPHRAHVVVFDLLRLSCLRVLAVREPLRLSLIGAERAQQIAREQGAELSCATNGS